MAPSSLKAIGIGDIHVRSLLSNGQHKECVFREVLHVPGCRRNLLSVCKIEGAGKALVFDNYKVDIIEKSSGQVHAEGFAHEGLYVMRVEVEYPLTLMMTESMDDHLWHERFCHINMQSLRKLADKQMVVGLELTNGKAAVCEGCAVGKSTKAACVPLKRPRTTEVLQLVHADVCTMSVISNGGSKYFLTMVDDFSRKLTVYTMKTKDEVSKYVKQFIAKAERETGKRVVRFQSDNGMEFCNNDLQDYFNEQGIHHQRTNVETPQMNGVAERVNRTLLNLVRSTLHSAKLPPQFWAETLMAVAYIRNLVPHASLENMVPMEVWCKRKPSVRHLKAFGCLAYVHNVQQGRKNLDSRAHQCIMVGYASQTRGYRLWSPQRNNGHGGIIFSKHVKFDESKSGYEAIYGTPASSVLIHDDWMLPEQESKDQEKESILVCNEKPDGTNDEEEDEVYEDAEDVTESLEPPLSNPNPQEGRKRRPGRPKKVIRNPYGRAGKPRQNVEINYMNVIEPSTVKEALESPQAEEWKNAMDDEYETLQKRKTWVETDLPENKTCVGSKWVYQTKRDENGKITRYKARLVAQGFSQQEGVDYHETYAPVATFVIFRLLLALAVIFAWSIHHLDVKCAYLYGDLTEEVYMQLPEGYSHTAGKVAKLLRPIYGLKQSGREWNTKLNDFLQQNGFTRILSHSCVYVRSGIILAVYVDDILVISRHSCVAEEFIRKIGESFDVQNLGEVRHFLGVKIERCEDQLHLSQETYIGKLLKTYCMTECRPASTPLEPGIVLTKDDCPKTESERDDMKNVPYRGLIGSLMYLALTSRPDLMFAVSKLSQFNSNPGRIHWNQAKRVLRYLSATSDYKLIFSGTDDPDVTLYSDSDWAGDVDDRRSFSGYAAFIGCNLIDWQTSKQKNISMSTMEAEYVALAMVAKESMWLQMLFKELQLPKQIDTPFKLMCDNRAAIQHAKNNIERRRTRHIDISYHVVREKIKDGLLELFYVPTRQNNADVFTKALTPVLHVNSMNAINLRRIGKKGGEYVK